MNAFNKPLTIILLFFALLAFGCGDDNTTGDGPGSIIVQGSWDGDISEDASFKAAVTECPLLMPPTYNGEETIDNETGEAFIQLDDIEPGQWCVMAYIDMDTTDGLLPKSGLDVINTGGNEKGGIPVEIISGETITLDIGFAIVQE